MTTTTTTAVTKTVKKTVKTTVKTTGPKISKHTGKPVKKRASDKQKAAGAKAALAMKKAGKGIFAPKQLSVELQAICGGKKSLPRTEVTKNIWAYIKKNTLSQGRVIKPDAALKKIFPVASLDMLKMAGFVSKHLS